MEYMNWIQIYIIILSFYLHGLRQLSAVRLEVHI